MYRPIAARVIRFGRPGMVRKALAAAYTCFTEEQMVYALRQAEAGALVAA